LVKILNILIFNPGMVVQAYTPSTWEAEAGGSRVQGQPGVHSETVSKKLSVDYKDNFQESYLTILNDDL
jgi:hypothetical protein